MMKQTHIKNQTSKNNDRVTNELYARQYYVLLVETRDHVTANHQKHDGQARDDANNATDAHLVKKVVGRFGDKIINSLCSLVMKPPHAARAYKIRAIIREKQQAGHTEAIVKSKDIH